VRVVLNVLWFIFGGLITAIAWALVGLVLLITIIGIPFGLQAIKIALFALWPFGRTLVKRATAGAPSLIGNVIWVILFGWWLALLHLLSAVVLGITIIGLPLAAAHIKLIPVSFWPFGREIVPISQLSSAEHSQAVTVGD
jgi:uncharacterized membrane protein YccF (DUF307 family)